MTPNGTTQYQEEELAIDGLPTAKKRNRGENRLPQRVGDLEDFDKTTKKDGWDFSQPSFHLFSHRYANQSHSTSLWSSSSNSLGFLSWLLSGRGMLLLAFHSTFVFVK